MDLNKGFMKKYSGIPFSFLFFSYVLWKILVITHYIDFMECYWGCEVHSLQTTALVGLFYNEGETHMETW